MPYSPPLSPPNSSQTTQFDHWASALHSDGSRQEPTSTMPEMISPQPIAPHQLGVGATDGPNALYKNVEFHYHSNPQHTIIHFDLSDAFTTMPRSAILTATSTLCPPLQKLARVWYTPHTTIPTLRGVGGLRPTSEAVRQSLEEC